MKKIISAAISLAPSLAFAQQINNVNDLTRTLTSIGNVVIEILIAFAIIYIIFNVIRFIMAADKPEDRNSIGKAILWGIVGLFVILSIWGLVRILTSTFRTDTNAPTNQYPRIQYPESVTN